MASLRRYPTLVALGLVPLVALAVFAYLVSARAVEDLVHSGNDAAALITAALVEREFDLWVATLTNHAESPAVAAAVAAHDAAEVRRRLEAFVTSHHRLDRAFVTDTTGLLWVDHPIADESLGRRFAERDWFLGVRAAGAPYVSEVYRRHAAPQILVVTVAAPVRAPVTGAVAGFLAAQVRLDDLSDLLGRVEVGQDGVVLLRDHAGSVAAHPSLDLPARLYQDYAAVAVPPDSGGVLGGPVRSRYADPISGQPVLASAVAARVGGHAWTVLAQQPVAAATAPIRGLAARLAGAGFLMTTLLGGLLWGLNREDRRRREAERELVALNEDLEERVERRTAALREREEQLRRAQRMEAVGSLAGGIAHDFNNLLTVILGSVDYLRSRFESDPEAGREVDAVGSAARRAADLTRQLLAFSRKQVVQPRVLDVNDSIERMRGILERTLGEDIELVWRLGEDLHPVKFDPGQIEQVVMNLAVNARDAMPGGGTLTIATWNVDLGDEHVAEQVGTRAGPHVALSVSDTGTGMDAATREQIFDPFYTTKKLGHGTGLGLATVYGIVDQAGGGIRVDSEPGRGTTFEVYLPRTDDAPRPAEGSPSSAAPVAGCTILIVEDEAPLRELLVRVLENAGYHVLSAGTAAEADAVAGNAVDGLDLLLTDVVLPDAGGPDVAARLERRLPGLRVLYMSGYTDDAIVRRGVRDDGTAFIEKPFRPQELLERIRHELTRG